MMRRILVPFLALTMHLTFAQSLVINEVVSKNNTSHSSLSGTNPDWIELYNPTASDIDLTGYFLTDDPLDRAKWQFKNGEIKSESFLLIEASGNSIDSISSQAVVTSEITTVGYDYQDADEAEPGTSKVNYTIYPNTAFGLKDGKPVVGAQFYLGLPAPSGFSFAGLFVKYKNWGQTIDRTGYDTLRVKMYLETGKSVNLRMAQTGLENWRNYGVTVTGRGDTSWYNVPLKGVDTGLLDLSILEGLQVEATGELETTTDFILFDIQFKRTEDEKFNTNFKLSSAGESLYLFDSDTALVDVVSVPALLPDYSYGRETDGSNTWVIFESPTPENSNGGLVTNGFCDQEITFSQASGFYQEDQVILLSGPSEIRFTLDGSNPDKQSELYSAGLALDTATVIKAACFDNNTVPERVFTNTYFIGYESKLPVWSLSTHPGNFFDADTGIYVLGPDVLPTDPSPFFNANFWKDWERPVHVEFFETDGTKKFSVDCGIKLFGNFSRANDKKSLTLKFRKKYGPGRLDYPLFPEHPEISSFNDIILRSSGGDANLLDCRDGFNQTLIQDANFETQKYRASVIFINGEYWGIHNIREKSDVDYFTENYGIPTEDIDLISGHYQEFTGQVAGFRSFMDSLREDLYSYAEVKEIVDIESFIDFHSYEIYIANYDWPANNQKYWRQRSTNGKWRWFIYDTDYSTSIYSDPKTASNFNAFNKAITFVPEGWPNSEESTLMLRKLLNFPEFKRDFVNRYCDLMNTTLKPTNVLDELQTKVVDVIEEEAVLSRERWGQGGSYWYVLLEEYRDFWRTRPEFARANMQNELNLDAQVNVTLEVSPTGAGYIKMNSVEVAENETWTGIYFKGIPVTIEAVANPGFEFNSWVTSSNEADLISSKLSGILLNEGDDFKAIFTGSAAEQKITISEINYHSALDLNTEDWVELYNYGTDAVDLSDWKLKDSRAYNNYFIPDGTVLEAGEYLVLVENKEAFSSVYSGTSLDNTIGPFGFSLDNGGERIQLYDNRNNIVQDVTYDDDATKGWSTYADGQGGTLELENVQSLATSTPSDWVSLCFGGSPNLAFNESCPKLLSLEESAISNTKYSVAPNPTSGLLLLSLELVENTNALHVYSLDGRFISELEPSAKLDVSSLEKGIYLLKVTTENNEQVSIKFIKE